MPSCEKKKRSSRVWNSNKYMKCTKNSPAHLIMIGCIGSPRNSCIGILRIIDGRSGSHHTVVSSLGTWFMTSVSSESHISAIDMIDLDMTWLMEEFNIRNTFQCVQSYSFRCNQKSFASCSLQPKNILLHRWVYAWVINTIKASSPCSGIWTLPCIWYDLRCLDLKKKKFATQVLHQLNFTFEHIKAKQ